MAGATNNCTTGFKYELQQQCEQTCNGPCDHNTKTCTVKVSAGEKTKYNVSGSLGVPNVFGLGGGWENEKVTESGCEFSDSCNQPNCCVGPAYSYIKYSYNQRYVGLANYSVTPSAFCRACSTNGGLALLLTYGNGLCGQAQHNEWAPALTTVGAFCTSQGEQ